MAKNNSKLEKSYEFFRSLVENQVEMIVRWLPDGTRLYVNKSYCDYFEFTKEQATGTKLFQGMSEDEQKFIKEKIKLLSQENQEIIFEFEQLLNGSKKWFHWSNKGFFDDNGELKEILSVGRDITDQKKAEEKIKLLSSVVKQSTEGMAVVELNGKILFVNKEWCKMHGYKSPENLLGKNLAIFHSKEQLENEVIPFNEKVKKIGTYSGEIWHTTKEGKTFPTIMVSTLLKNDQGKPYAMAGIAKDITKKKKAEKELKDSYKLNKKYLHLAGNILISLDTKGNIILLNKKGCEVLGYKEKELIGKNWFDTCLPKENISEIKTVFEKIIKGEIKTVENYENEVITKSGKTRLISWHNTILKDDKGKIISLLSSGEDITEKKKIEKELKDSELKFKSIFENANDSILIMDKEKFIDCNKKTLDIFGCKKKEIIGHNPFNFSPKKQPDERASKESALEKINAALQGNPQRFEWLHIKKDGTPFNAEVTLNKIELDKPYIQAIVRDISIRKKVEKELKTSKDQLNSILRVAPTAIGLVKDRQLLWVSPIMEKMLGYSKEELIGNSARKLYEDDEEFERVGKIKYNMIRKTGTGQIDTKWVKKDGSIINVDLRSTPLDKNDLSKGVIFTGLDITEKKKIENQIKSSKDQLEKIINSASELIVSVDEKGNITSWNNAMEKITGYGNKEMINKNINQDTFCDGCKIIAEIIKNALKNKKTELIEIELIDKNNNPSTILVNTSFIRDSDYNISGVVLVGRDISDRKILSKLVFPGVSYILHDKTMKDISKIFNSYAKKPYSLMCVSRGNLTQLKTMFDKKTKFVLMSETSYEKVETADNPENILKIIKQELSKNKRTILLLDRLEYISTVFGFNELLKLLYKLNDTIQFTKNIILIHINSNAFSEKEMSVLNTEFVSFPKIKKDVKLTDMEKGILQFILNKETLNLSVQSGDIGKEFNLARLTTKKIIEEMQLSGLLRAEKKGRSKILIITEKGKEILLV